ncbi:MAG: imidazole glycerol phosphate synthase subunit HisF [Longimicrobiales bacterium]|nr:imidazole glycerol phosphate synthase subunit HisF [Longimicrobiales bacterium]
MSRVVIIDSGVANLASVRSAFTALGVESLVTRDPVVVRDAGHVVLPGVGRFQSGMERLRESGLDQAVLETDRAGKPLLAICLGMQMLGEGSEESPGIPGLGLFPGRFTRLPSSVRVPHLGWNGVAPDGPSALPEGTAAFANSFGLPKGPEGWSAAWTTHGTRFVSALARGRTLACQFHPELSGDFGMGLMRSWLAGEDQSPGASEEQNPGQLAHRIIPCLDVKNGRVVKGIRFQNLRDSGDPAEQATAYERQGADEIVLLDVAASPEAKKTQLETVRAVREGLHIPLTVGGGVRAVGDARDLLSAGADKVSVNTAAVRDPSLISRLAGLFGSQCIVLAIDARREGDRWDTLVMGGREPAGRDAIEWAREGTRLGAGEILLTSWDRDGTRSGCDLELLRAASEAVPVPVIASGGIGTREDVAAAFRSGADAVLAASVFHDGELTVKDIKDFLDSEGVVVRR